MIDILKLKDWKAGHWSLLTQKFVSTQSVTSILEWWPMRVFRKALRDCLCSSLLQVNETIDILSINSESGNIYWQTWQQWYCIRQPLIGSNSKAFASSEESSPFITSLASCRALWIESKPSIVNMVLAVSVLNADSTRSINSTIWNLRRAPRKGYLGDNFSYGAKKDGFWSLKGIRVILLFFWLEIGERIEKSDGDGPSFAKEVSAMAGGNYSKCDRRVQLKNGCARYY